MNNKHAGKFVLIFIFSFFLCSACVQSYSGHEDSDAKTDLEIDILRITLNARELATIPGRNLTLTASYFPDFATRRDIKWISSDISIAEVSSDTAGNTGTITINLSFAAEPVSTVIKVYSSYDPSISAECIITVFPEYPRNRSFNFPENPAANAVKYPADINGDIDLGSGIFLLTGTGGADEYNRGSAGPGEYIIDPENPYQFGIVPNGGIRSLGATPWDGGGAAFVTGASTGHIRTGGDAARQIKIAAVFGPFEIFVNYMTSTTGSPRNADIRIGDTEGIRIEGEVSNSTSPAEPKTVSYRFESEEFVPLIFVECNGGIRIYDVIIRDIR